MTALLMIFFILITPFILYGVLLILENILVNFSTAYESMYHQENPFIKEDNEKK